MSAYLTIKNTRKLNIKRSLNGNYELRAYDTTVSIDVFNENVYKY